MNDNALLPIHFFTIVLDGQPYIKYHINILHNLKIPWHWHIIEGLAELNHDTSWSVPAGGKAPLQRYQSGRSNDGTSEYLDYLSKEFPSQITIYRKPLGSFWDGKIEMVRAPLPNILEPCILWQIDSDELWTQGQIETMHRAFKSEPNRTAALFWCHYFVGPDKIISTRNCYGNNPTYEWLRVWLFLPGMRWIAHEPPVLGVIGKNGQIYNSAKINPFKHHETEEMGLVFQHMSYTTEAQLRFKEEYYGYVGATKAWNALQLNNQPRILLRRYFNWVADFSIVESTANRGIKNLMKP